MAHKTILKWAGSKVRIMEQLRPHLPKAKRLVEPFAGSCAVMMNTDYEKYLIADVNQDLISMYQVISEDPDTIDMAHYENLLMPENNNERVYYGTRSAFNLRNKPKWDQAWTFLYLNRLCFNGLCRYNKKGEFNVPYGRYKNPYFPEKEIISFIDRAKNADIVCLEWQDTLSLVEDNDGIYCDPPYMAGRDSFTQYHTAGFTNSDHEALAFALKDINDMQGNPITVSNSLEAKELYADLGFIIHEIEAPRTIAANGNRKPAKEIITVLNGGAQ